VICVAKLPKVLGEATPCFCVFAVAACKRISEKNPAFSVVAAYEGPNWIVIVEIIKSEKGR
jgi:hypothetical protein